MSSITEIYEKYDKKMDPHDLNILLSHITKKSKEFIITHPEFKLTRKQGLKLGELAKRRMRGEPIAYLVGHKEFFGLDFMVNENTLVPRPETELLIEEILKINPKGKIIADIGTGSGNIIISLAKNLKNKNYFYGIDISEKALRVARKNAKLHKIEKKIKFLKGNLIKPLLKKKDPKEELILVANLPYLDTKWKNLLKSSETEGLKFEPDSALYGGSDGLDFYRELAGQIKELKNHNDMKIILLCEIGHLQKREMEKIFNFSKKCEFRKDLAGKTRIFTAKIR